MVSVKITNYESIRHAKIDVEGFTTLVGRNALGKSATLRAINAALTNKSGTDFISWGETYCEVHIITDGLDLLWHKEDGNNFYMINGVEYKKIGRGDPPASVAEAGFKVLKIGSEKINLNYAQQFVPLFLVDRLDSRSADLLTSVYGLDRLYKAVDLCNKDQRKNSDTLRLREKDLELAEKDLKKFEHFDEIRDEMAKLSETKDNLTTMGADLQDLKGRLGRILELGASCKSIQKALSIDLPEHEALDSQLKAYKSLESRFQSFQRLSEKAQELEKAVGVPLPTEDKDALLEASRDLRELSVRHTRMQGLSNDLKDLKEALKVTLPQPGFEVDEVQKLSGRMEALVSGKRALTQLKTQIDELDPKIEQMHKEMDDFERCPLCGKKLEKAT